jgi:putative nucleotidyltransferase with HDIG domain
MNLPITREQAIELLKKYNPVENISDWNHYFESEAIMKELAKKLGEDQDFLAMLGLLHDIDWGITKNNSIEHLTKAPEILRNVGFDEEFINLIVSHGCGFECGIKSSHFIDTDNKIDKCENLGLKDKKRTKKLEFALAAAETLTGLIHAYALMRNKRISDMELSGLKKKFKDKAFAAAINREIVKEIEKTGLTLDEFLQIGIEGVKNIKDKVGLE